LIFEQESLRIYTVFSVSCCLFPVHASKFRNQTGFVYMIRAVLFDLDDTLIDHDAAIRDAAGALFDQVIPDGKHELKNLDNAVFR
ncbi:MAG: hypothetical protein ACYT04_89620, partial [Nostoc sp.]